MSSQLLESEVRELAYSKWEEAGCPFITTEDERNRFWFEAEKEILSKRSSCCEEKMPIKTATDFETTQVCQPVSKKSSCKS